jgi:hypothetical protein
VQTRFASVIEIEGTNGSVSGVRLADGDVIPLTS